ncbi:preprotein translocase subunit TatA [Intrasporangium oryzae NRRL B-24470]|uniref:Sec-independent protein translocase protein TatA n=1 Tax=Intrasporangium oryzae NRRL B-24470 TaxID=1386089 RepID=W9G8Q2_9MICO|nr:Sec-independent protein translocase subunit TatA [Intrasporangium oryzae]EWT02551.1 preprotein translocase subunit TatA [Intrasporangium oryzae NRRL B-24470]
MADLGAQELILIAIVVVLLFGWKRMPDMARSVGRSVRIFKSEVDEMKKDGSTSKSPAAEVPDAVAEADRRAAEAERLAAEARAEADRLREAG